MKRLSPFFLEIVLLKKVFHYYYYQYYTLFSSIVGTLRYFLWQHRQPKPPSGVHKKQAGSGLASCTRPSTLCSEGQLVRDLSVFVIGGTVFDVLAGRRSG